MKHFAIALLMMFAVDASLFAGEASAVILPEPTTTPMPVSESATLLPVSESTSSSPISNLADTALQAVDKTSFGICSLAAGTSLFYASKVPTKLAMAAASSLTGLTFLIAYKQGMNPLVPCLTIGAGCALTRYVLGPCDSV
jgi:hypothetical protein